MMVWHIFKKDLKLLWMLALAGAIGQLLLTLLVYHSQHDSRSALEAVAAVFTLGLLVVMSLSILLAIQHESLPSTHQDWLIRPIRRIDLLSAKLLFVAVVVHGPILLGGLLRGVAEGLPIGATLSAICLSSLEIALLFSLPLMVIAALTKSVTEAMLAALGVFFLIMLLRVIFSSTPTGDAGIAWVWRDTSHALLLLFSAAVLLLQYFRRDTRRSRWLCLIGILLFMSARSLPWTPAFTIQRIVTPNPEARLGTTIGYAATTAAASIRPMMHLFGEEEKADQAPHNAAVIPLTLPLSITGLPAGAILHIDRMTLDIDEPSGKRIYHGTGGGFEYTSSNGVSDVATVGHTVEIPSAVYAVAGDTALTLHMHYWFTIFRSHAAAPFPALDGDLYSPQLGHCTSRMNDAATDVDLRCFQTSSLPACTSAVLLSPGSNRRNTEVFDCTPDYEPRALNFASEPVDHSHSKLPFRDPAAPARYPVDQAALNKARILITIYEPESHFSQSVTASDISLPALRAGRP